MQCQAKGYATPRLHSSARNFHLGAIALGTEIPHWDRGGSPGTGSGEQSPPEAEAVCRHCWQIWLQKRSKIEKFAQFTWFLTSVFHGAVVSDIFGGLAQCRHCPGPENTRLLNNSFRFLDFDMKTGHEIAANSYMKNNTQPTLFQ